MASRLEYSNIALSLAKELQELEKFDPQQAMLAYSVDAKYYPSLKVKKLQDIFEVDNVPTLATMKKYRGEAVTNFFLQNWIKQLGKMFSVSNGMDESVLEMGAELILESYFFYKLSDFKLFAKKVVKGDFGVAFNRFDIPTLMDWLKQYNEQRLMLAANRSQVEKQENIKLEGAEFPEQVKKLMIELNSQKKLAALPSAAQKKEYWAKHGGQALKNLKEKITINE